jgi:Ca-activated chloride channel family protein
LYEIIPAESEEAVGKIDPLKYQPDKKRTAVKPDENAELLTIKLRYKKPDGFNSILVDKPVEGNLVALDNSSDNFRFSAAVAEFGLLLRSSEFKSNASFSQVLELANSARGEDKEGYRIEFVKMVQSAGGLAAVNDNN